MTGKALWFLASMGLLLGVLHLALTLPIYGGLSLEALWFGGSGLAIVCCALMNLVALRNSALSSRWAVALANLLVAGFFAVAWPLLPSPQVAAGFAIFITFAAYFGLIPLWRRKAAPRATKT